MAKKKSVHYVDNKQFLQAMIDWRESCDVAEALEKISPPVTNYIGECFLKIATHLAYRPNFINYTYRDEMVSDGIENCLQYVKNFNPEKSKILLHTLHKSSITLFLDELQRRKNKVM